MKRPYREPAFLCSLHVYRQLQVLCGTEPDPWPQTETAWPRDISDADAFVGVDLLGQVRFKDLP